MPFPTEKKLITLEITKKCSQTLWSIYDIKETDFHAYNTVYDLPKNRHLKYIINLI